MTEQECSECNINTIKKSIEEISDINSILLTTIEELNLEDKLSHFGTKTYLQNRLLLISQMQEVFNKYSKLFRKDGNVPEKYLSHFDQEIENLKNNQNKIVTILAEEKSIA